MTTQGANHVVDTARVELFAPLLGPSLADLAAGSVDGLGDLEQMALAWKMSTIWTAPGKCSSAKFQIQGAPSPRTT